jgi:hypothetical protein
MAEAIQPREFRNARLMMGHFLGSDVGPGKESGEGFSLGCSREEIALKRVFTGHHPFSWGVTPSRYDS